ncbi:hypothetical protein Micbo1qcDRAFT_223912 [Microdochium bolleyi]|uniref:Uncharacterized protein n=1 Tax=Microdochium bolleyi TaxID=196109 RepID=A0A136J3Y3_9PEZI|nr:hypothetical protein Micbo1qcDRAFT_223912 [Microdochium bolleyi]
MQITTLLTTFLAATTATANFKVRKCPTDNCSRDCGRERTYQTGVCNPLYTTDVGMRVVSHTIGCKIRGYPGGNCDGNVLFAFSSHQCHRLPKAWSFRVEC